MAHYGPQEWFYATGELAANQRAAVFGPGDQNTFAPIFSDAGLTVPLANPTTTDGSGNLEFYAEEGEYWVFVGPVGTGDSVLVNLGSPAGPVFSVDDVPPDPDGDVPLGALRQIMADAKGDMIAATGPDAFVRVPVGVDGFVLTADSGASPGVSWQAGGGGGGGIPTTIIDAKGDLIAGTAPDTPARVPVGTDGQVLRADPGAAPGVAWDTLTAADVGAVPVDPTANIMYGTTTAGAPLNREVSTIASPDTIGWRTSENQLRADTVTDGDPAADPDDLTNRAYVQAAMADLVPETRAINTTNGLTGGGDLTADRTIQPVYGATANTVAQGNDTRIVGAIQAAIVDAKGDIIAATAADTVTRVPVGTDGKVLTADSGAAPGVSWQTPATAISPTIFDAKGDLLGASAADTPVRIPVGTDGQYLRANSAAGPGVDWDTITPSDIGAVPTSRLINTTNGLQGGGDLSADRTIEPTYGTGANTVAQGNDTRIVNALQQTILDAKGDLIAASAADTPVRVPVGANGTVLGADSGQASGLAWVTAILASLIDAKGDLIVGTANDTPSRLAVGTDGQALRANSGATPGVDWHTFTAADVGAIANSLVDAKGDLIVATANDTPSRVAVGANGTILVADSAQTPGVKWATPGSAGVGGMPFAIAPRASEYFQAAGVVTVRSSKAATLNVSYYYPIPILAATTLTGVAWETTNATATAVVRLGLYAASASNGVGSLIVDFGTFLSDTLGVIAATVSQAVSAGLLWLSFTPQVAVPNFRHGAGWNPYVGSTSFPNGTGTGWNNTYFQTGVNGALPSSPTLGGSTDSPLVGVKFA